MFNKLCIIGVGLIGGSVARAARQKNLCQEIVGFGRKQDQDNLDKAKQLNVIDAYNFDLQLAVQDADCVLIATPVGAIENVFRQLKECWSTNTIYTDVGSTKQSVIEAANKVFGCVPENFVPTHPIAGAEKNGVEAAKSDLYTQKRLILTPVDNTAISASNKISLFWQQLGAEVSLMSVEHHDAVLAATSHLPHILAYALVDLLGRKDEQDEIFKFAAGGFRDFTRIASSDPTMWQDICLANKNEIVPLMKQLEQELGMLARMLENNEKEQLFNTFVNAKNARQRFLNQFNS